MRELLHLEQLREGKVLLAFSGGVDSTALFHLLLENNISFDIAHVNYHTRAASGTEALNAQMLAHTYNLQCHSHSCHLNSTNFEHCAREERYTFFETVMKQHNYTYLLTAHQLNDKLEWMLMQLVKGSGLPELLGIRSIDHKNSIPILRPLLGHDKEEIENYLRKHNLSHFIDESNNDERYTRNRFRNRYSTPLLHDHADGIRRSFHYLEEDNDLLIEQVRFKSVQELHYAANPDSIRSLIYGIDQHLKSLGIVMSGNEKESLKKERSFIISRQYVVSMEENNTFIAPYHPNIVMDKGFKEECRKLKIHPKLRGYLHGAPEAFALIRRLKEPLKPLQCD